MNNRLRRPRGRVLGAVGACIALVAVGAPAANASVSASHPAAHPAKVNSNRAQLQALLNRMPASFRHNDPIAKAIAKAMTVHNKTTKTLPSAAAPGGAKILEYPAPPATFPIDIKNGPDGNVWFSYPLGMGRINPLTKKITLFPGPLTEGVPYAVNGGPGPWMYFTSLGVSGITGNDIGRINVFTHQYQLFPIPTSAAYPADLKTGADHNIWFTEAVAGKVGQFNTTTHQFHEIVTGPGTLPQDVATGEGSCLVFRQCNASGTTGINYKYGPLAGGQVWYTLMGPTPSGAASRLPSPLPGLPIGVQPPPVGSTRNAGNALFTVNPFNYAVHKYPYPTAVAGTLDVEPGGPNNHEVWFPEDVGNKIGYIDTLSHKITEQALPTAGALPFTIGPTPKNITENLNFALEQRANQVAVVTNPGTRYQAITEIPIPTGPLALPIDLAANSRSKSTFFAELVGNNIAEIVVPGSVSYRNAP